MKIGKIENKYMKLNLTEKKFNKFKSESLFFQKFYVLSIWHYLLSKTFHLLALTLSFSYLMSFSTI
jgi:hypothetical protein